jgi:gamma-glutamyltranspeptidase
MSREHPQPAQQPQPAHYPQHRPVTLATHGVVAAPHYLAAQAGLELLRAGGNAIDAAIATNAALQVVYPHSCGLGGDLFLIYYEARTGRLHGLNASGRSARAATIERYHALGHERMPDFGIHTVTVPGCVDGWGMASDRFGRLGLARALAPAITYAEEGFPVGPGLAAALRRVDQMPHTHRSFREHFMPGGAIPAAGSIARAPGLARSLRQIAMQGADTFYRGALAERIAAFFAAEGGLITLEDLEAHHGEWVTPLSTRFGDLDIYELPPNTQGVTALQMLGIVERLALGAEPLAPETVHLSVEAKRIAWADRSAYLTDPLHMRVDPSALIAPDYLAERAALIDPARVLTSVAPGSLAGDTIYLCTADGEGNAVSFIQSNYRGFGSGYVVDGLGIALQNRGAYFSLDPEAANALAPSKRTLHTLIPSLALRDGRLALVFGTMGGDGQPQTHLQVYTALVKYGLNIQAAIELPRWLDGHVYVNMPERVFLERRFPPKTVRALRELGHDVALVGEWDSQMGHASGIVVDAERGVLAGGTDPRSEGAAVGW